ncbi:MAG TPA: PEGA domain-containing protein [Polyangiaceae bacterium]|nr:PEGA domain-containing protein [Polyangiaceae bacterium]
MHVPTTGLEVARISAKLGKLVEARDVALEVIRMPAAAREAKPFKVARAAAEDLARELATQIPTLRLELTPEAAADQASLEIDERSVPPAALGLGYALNPGRHRVQIAATGYRPVAQDITLRPGETKTLRVKLVLAPTAKVQPPPPPEASPAPPPERSSTWPQWVGFSLGGAGLVAGTVAGILSLNRTRAAKEHCTGNLCTPEAEHDLNAAMTMANISNAGFGVAVLGASIGLTSYLLSGNTPQSTGTTLHFAAGPGVATVRLQGTLW